MSISLANGRDSLCLQEGQIHARHLQTPVRVQVRCGLLWLTVEGWGADVWLSPGRNFDFHGRGLAVFEAAKGYAEFDILPLPGWWARLRQRFSGSRPVPAPGEPEAAPPVSPASGVARISHLLPHGLIRWF